MHRIEAKILILLIIVSSLTVGIGRSYTSQCGENNLNGHMEHRLSDGHQLSQNYNVTSLSSVSLVRLLDTDHRPINVLVGDKSNLTWVNVGSSTIISPDPSIRSKIDPNLLNLTHLVTKGYLFGNRTQVIVSFSNTETLREMSSDSPLSLTLQGQKLYRSRTGGTQTDLYAARLNFPEIFALAEDPVVSYVWLDRKFYANLDQSVRIVKEPSQWARIETTLHRSITGSGIRIAILDSGIDSNHPDFFFSNGTSKIAQSVSFTGEPSSDNYGHGTHVASIAAGTGAAAGGQYTGVAPGATLLNVKVLNDFGQGYESAIISGIQWAVDNNASVINMSFGGDTGSDGTDPVSTTINWATEQGAVCVVAAGNSGPEMYTILNPGGANVAITVGASTKGDQIADFSSTGPTDDYEIKPDLVAPGKDIVAARASGTSMGTPVSQYYTQASGTSMATPHVAGAVVLLLDVHPSWAPGQIKNVLTNYAWNIGSNVLRRGSGRLRICESVTAAVVGNSSISFGAVKVGTVYNHILSFENLVQRAVSVTLSVETWHITDGTRYSSVALSVSDLYLTPMAVQTIEVSLNVGASLPPGYFEGKITATFEAIDVRIPFLFCLVAQISADVVDVSGSKLMAAYALIDADSGQVKSYTAECQQADFTVLQGTYIVQAMNVYSWRVNGGFDATIAFVIHEEFTVGIDETKNLRFSLASAHRTSIRTTDTASNPLYLTQKRLLTPFYSMSYFSEIGVLNTQDIYVTDLSQYMQTPSYFGFAGLSTDDVHWADAGILTSEVDAYFIGWDLSQIGNPTFPPALDYLNSELATFEIENLMPKSTTMSTIWFNQLADIWQSGLWPGVKTYPGITWKAHILPYQHKENPSTSWSMLEWSCMYATSTSPEESPEVYVIDRHFQPITKGETTVYRMGKTPLLPQAVSDNATYYGSGSYIPYYPLLVDRDVFLVKTDLQAQKNVEISKDGTLLSNSTRPWNQEAVDISQPLQAHGYGVYTFRVTTETSLNLSTRNAARYVINYTSFNADYIPPRIERIDCAPCFTENPFNILLRFTDDNHLRDVSLSYSFDNSPLTQTTLTDEEEGFYEANITVPPSARSLSLLVEASDGAGNVISYKTNPAAIRAYKTQIEATLEGDNVSGKLNVVNGVLLQPVFIKVESSANTKYTLTNDDGIFTFTLSQSQTFPLDLEMISMGSYASSTFRINVNQIHDVSIIEVAPSRRIVGGEVYIEATVTNEGDCTENINITFFANTTSIGSQYFTLSSGYSIAVRTLWNTTDLVKGNYTIKAYLEPVLGEIDVEDNMRLGGLVVVTIQGDINGDGKVNMVDIGWMSHACFTRPGDPRWNSNADINNDNIVDMRDLGLACANFGNHL